MQYKTVDDFENNGFTKHQAKQLHNLYQKVNVLNLWNKFKALDDNMSFMFSNIDWVNSLYNEVSEDGHSGASYCICLQQMKYIAKHENVYLLYFIKKMEFHLVYVA